MFASLVFRKAATNGTIVTQLLVCQYLRMLIRIRIDVYYIHYIYYIRHDACTVIDPFKESYHFYLQQQRAHLSLVNCHDNTAEPLSIIIGTIKL